MLSTLHLAHCLLYFRHGVYRDWAKSVNYFVLVHIDHVREDSLEDIWLRVCDNPEVYSGKGDGLDEFPHLQV